MQLHQIHPTIRTEDRKRVGRGGKRGTFSGRGSKGQKSRAGARIRPGFRGGDNPIWKLFPKQRGASKKVEIKHALFQPHYPKPAVINLGKLDAYFHEGDKVTSNILVKKGIIKTAKKGIKILSDGELKKKLNFVGLKISKVAVEKIIKAGGTIQ
jgi:large subunit ribosomal protein L15